MSIFTRIRGAKKAADEHRKSQQLKELDVSKTPYRHVPTHAEADALRIVQPNDEVLRGQIKEQHRRRSELGPTRSASSLPISHAVYRRQNSGTSVGDISIASTLLQPPPANFLPPMKPPHPSKMSTYRYSGFNPSAKSRHTFTSGASFISKGKSPLSTMTSSINELPEEGLQPGDSPIESSKQSTKSMSSSSSECLEMRYSTPGQSFAQTSAPHTRATSVASRADSPKTRRPLHTDMQHIDEPPRSKSPVHVFPSPIPESASPKAFDAELEAIKPYHTAPDRLADQRLSTPITHASTITPDTNPATPKQSDDEWFTNHSSQHSTPTPRRHGKNFSRPTIVQEPNPPPLELLIKPDEHFERLDLEVPPELISVGHASTYAEIDGSQSRKTNVPTRDSRTPRPRPPSNERQPQQYGQKPQSSRSIPIPAQAYNAPKPPNTQASLRQEAYEIPSPKFSPRDTISTERPTLRGAHPNYTQGRMSYQQPMQSRQQDYTRLQSVQASHGQVLECPETFSFVRQVEADLEHARNQAYQQLSANDPSQQHSFPVRGNSQIANHHDAPPVPLATKPMSQIRGPSIRPITYTQVVHPIVSDSPQQLQTTSPMASPMMSPARSPAIKPVRNSRLVGFFGRGSSNAEEAVSPTTETPQQPPKKEEKRKSRNFLRRGNKASINAS